eukprot:7949693-Pyramimonas_sp.AAC.1
MGTKRCIERAWTEEFGRWDDLEKGEEPQGIPDTHRANDDPDEKAPRHSDLPEDVGSERKTSNLADLMGMPEFKSDKS